jgi:hypothetical protein
MSERAEITKDLLLSLFMRLAVFNFFFLPFDSNLFLDMVPMDQPEAALDLLKRFVNGIPF